MSSSEEIMIAHCRYYLNELTYSTEIESKIITEEVTEKNESKIIQEDEVLSVLPFEID